MPIPLPVEGVCPLGTVPIVNQDGTISCWDPNEPGFPGTPSGGQKPAPEHPLPNPPSTTPSPVSVTVTSPRQPRPVATPPPAGTPPAAPTTPPPSGREPGAPSVPYNPPGRIGLWPGPIFNPPSTSTSSSATTTTGGESTGVGGEGPIFVNTTNVVNVADQSASNAVQNVADAIQTGIAQSVENSSAVAQNTYNQIQGAINTNVSQVADALSIADSSIGGAVTGIETGIQSTLGGIGTVIASGIANSLNPAADALARIAIIISQQIGGLAGAIAQAVAQIAPIIVAAATGSVSAITGILQGIEGEISSSVVALTQLGSDVTGGFGSLDSTLQRVLTDFESYNTPFVESQTGYPDGGTLHNDLSDIWKAIAGLVTTVTTGLKLNASEWLAPPCNSKTLEDLLNAPQKFEQWDLGFFKQMAYALWGVVMSILKVYPTALKYWDILGQDVNQECPNGVLPPNALVDAVLRGFLTQTQAQADAGRGNLDATRFKLLQDLATHQLAPNELLEALFRGIVNHPDFVSALTSQGWTGGQIATLEALGVQILSVPQAQELHRRSLIDSQTLDAILKALRYDDAQRQLIATSTFRPPNMGEAISGLASEKALNALGVSGVDDVFTIPDPVVSAANNEGLDPQSRSLRWYSHWELGGLPAWISLYYRGQATLQQVYAVGAKEFIPSSVVDAFIAAGRPIIQFRTVATMVQQKIITDDQARLLLKEHGYDEGHINILLAYAHRPTRTQAAANAARQHVVALGIAKEEYIDGSITGDQFLAILSQHGFTLDGANTEIQVIDAHQAMLRRKEDAQFIVDQYGAGLIDIQTALAELAIQGLTPTEIARYEHKIRAFKTARTKIPSESDLNHFLQLSIITPQVYLSQLEAQGYTSTSAQWYLSWRQHPSSTAATSISTTQIAG